jgi:hypothetical protein
MVKFCSRREFRYGCYGFSSYLDQKRELLHLRLSSSRLSLHHLPLLTLFASPVKSTGARENVVPRHGCRDFSHLFASFRIFSLRPDMKNSPCLKNSYIRCTSTPRLGCSCLQLVALNCTNLHVVALRTRESKRFQHHKTPSTSCHLSSLRYVRLLRLKIRPPALGAPTHTPSLHHSVWTLTASIYGVRARVAWSRFVALHRG